MIATFSWPGGPGRDAVDAVGVEERVVAHQPRLALIDLDVDGALLSRRGRVDLGARHRHRRVARDDRREQPARRAAAAADDLDAERERAHVGDHDAALRRDRARLQPRLHRGAERDGLVGMHAHARLLAEVVAEQPPHHRHARAAADEHDVADAAAVELGVAQRRLQRLQRRAHQRPDDRLQLRPRQLQLAASAARRPARPRTAAAPSSPSRVDSSILACSAAAAAAAAPGASPRRSTPCAAANSPASQSATSAIEVAAAEVVVAGRRLHVEHAVEHLEHADVERAAAEVVDEHELLCVEVVEAVGQRRRGRLVEDAIDVEAGQLAGVLGRLPLRVGEVGRHRDHRLADGPAEVALGVLLQLLEHERRHLLRRVVALAQPHLRRRAHQPLELGRRSARAAPAAGCAAVSPTCSRSARSSPTTDGVSRSPAALG